jgi:hypothetical protein
MQARLSPNPSIKAGQLQLQLQLARLLAPSPSAPICPCRAFPPLPRAFLGGEWAADWFVETRWQKIYLSPLDALAVSTG